LLLVARAGDAKGVAEALAAGEDVNSQNLRGQTPLMLAAGLPDGVMLLNQLLDAGANIDDVDHQGWTALMHACRNDSPAASVLIERGASLSKKDAHGRTALILACLGSQSHHYRAPSLVRLLLEKGSRLGDKDSQGWSAFFHACELGNLGLVRFFLQKRKLNLEERALDGTTPLSLLQRQGIGRDRRAVCDENGKRITYSWFDLVMMDIDKAKDPAKGQIRPSSPEASPRQSPRSPGQSPRQVTRQSPRSPGRSPRHSPRSSPASSPRLQKSSPSASPASSPRAESSSRSSGQAIQSAAVPPDFVKGFKQFEATSPRTGKRRRSKDLLVGGIVGIPAAATCHPQDLTDCKAMVSLFVSRDGQEKKAVYIAGGHTHLIQSEKDLYRHIAGSGVDGV